MAGERGGEGFEDRLRAIGWLLDKRGQRLGALALDGDRVIVQAAVEGGVSGDMTLSPSELAMLRCAARGQRGRGDAAVLQEGYQGALRALGRMLDERGTHACQFHAHGDGFVVQVCDGEDGATWRPIHLGPDVRAAASDDATT